MPFPNKETQFKPGKTGNPKGYSRGRRVSDALIDLIDEKGAEKALAVRWLQEALKGDHKFFAMLLDRTEGKVADPSAAPAPTPVPAITVNVNGVPVEAKPDPDPSAPATPAG